MTLEEQQDRLRLVTERCRELFPNCRVVILVLPEDGDFVQISSNMAAEGAIALMEGASLSMVGAMMEVPNGPLN